MVSLLFARFGMRIPIRQFFLTTGGLLYAMAIIFAGKGVHELQEAGIVGLTAVSGVPRIDALGLFPTLESLLAQGVLVGLLLYGACVTLAGRRRRARAEAERPQADVRDLYAGGEPPRAKLGGRTGSGRP
jgi:high-affinity iron transporter